MLAPSLAPYRLLQLLPEICTEPCTVLPEYTKPSELFVRDALPVMVFPVTVTPPVFFDTATELVMWLFSRATAPLLLLTDTLPPIVLPPHPEPPMVTGPLVLDNDTEPPRVAAQKVTARAPLELTDPVMLPPLT